MRPYFVEWVGLYNRVGDGQWVDLDSIVSIHNMVITNGGSPRVWVELASRDKSMWVFLADEEECLENEKLKDRIHQSLENFIEAWRDKSE